jgi:carbon-monoxide dehydrogenase medium subunit
VYLPDFSYCHPESIPEICEILARYGSRAKVLAGGTDLLPKMKQALLSPEILVSLKGIGGLSVIEYVPGKGVVIGAGATHNDLVNSPVLQEKYLSLSEAAHSLANNQIRNMGTVGGNIVNAVPSSDLPPLLIALGADVKLVGAKGERILALEDFFNGPGKSVIAPDEILTEIIIHDQPATGSTYIKFALRRSGALAVVGVAVSLTVAKNKIQDARIVLGAVAPVPMRAKTAEKMLIGKVVNNQLLEEAGVIASGECRPISDIRGSEEYRRDMVKVFTRRALRKAIDQGHV